MRTSGELRRLEADPQLRNWVNSIDLDVDKNDKALGRWDVARKDRPWPHEVDDMFVREAPLGIKRTAQDTCVFVVKWANLCPCFNREAPEVVLRDYELKSIWTHLRKKHGYQEVNDLPLDTIVFFQDWFINRWRIDFYKRHEHDPGLEIWKSNRIRRDVGPAQCSCHPALPGGILLPPFKSPARWVVNPAGPTTDVRPYFWPDRTYIRKY